MLGKLASKFTPTGIDFAAMKSSESFARQPQRLRELRAEAGSEAGLALDGVPPLEDPDQAAARLEALQQRQQDLQAQMTPVSAQPEAPMALLSKAEEAQILGRQLQAEKSRQRIERLKDLQHSLQQLQQEAEGLNAAPQRLPELSRALQDCGTQLSAPYAGKTAPAEHEGLGLVRPLLARQQQKLACLKTRDREGFDKFCAAEVKLLEKLRAP
ncbi:MAG TPA: hypothetical protein V6D23_21705, partial [Candidatus Obscuribacterales bacterium]